MVRLHPGPLKNPLMGIFVFTLLPISKENSYIEMVNANLRFVLLDREFFFTLEEVKIAVARKVQE
jgi:hypothetical protein